MTLLGEWHSVVSVRFIVMCSFRFFVHNPLPLLVLLKVVKRTHRVTSPQLCLSFLVLSSAQSILGVLAGCYLYFAILPFIQLPYYLRTVIANCSSFVCHFMFSMANLFFTCTIHRTCFDYFLKNCALIINNVACGSITLYRTYCFPCPMQCFLLHIPSLPTILFI